MRVDLGVEETVAVSKFARNYAPTNLRPLANGGVFKGSIKKGQHLAPAAFGGCRIIDGKSGLHPAMRSAVVSLGAIPPSGFVQRCLQARGHSGRIAIIVVGSRDVDLRL